MADKSMLCPPNALSLCECDGVPDPSGLVIKLGKEDHCTEGGFGRTGMSAMEKVTEREKRKNKKKN